MDDIANKVKGKVDILVNNAGMLDKEPILQGAIPFELHTTGRSGIAGPVAAYTYRPRRAVRSSREPDTGMTSTAMHAERLKPVKVGRHSQFCM